MISGGAWLHGWPGLLSAYAVIQGPLLAGLVQARAPLRQLLASPLVAAPLTLLTGAALGAVGGGALDVSTAAALSATAGYVAGRALGRRRAPVIRHQRGALVADPAPAARTPSLRAASRGSAHRASSRASP
jgi:uncharacterized membrane protein YdjX (TVP38/TMEM64 family)